MKRNATSENFKSKPITHFAFDPLQYGSINLSPFLLKTFRSLKQKPQPHIEAFCMHTFIMFCPAKCTKHFVKYIPFIIHMSLRLSTVPYGHHNTFPMPYEHTERSTYICIFEKWYIIDGEKKQIVKAARIKQSNLL